MSSAICLAAALVGVTAGLYPEPGQTAPPPQTPIADAYRADAERIIQAALAGNDAWAKLEHLCLQIGHRLSGSKALDRATDWAAVAMKKDGHENVRTEKVIVPHWVRGHESATMLEPRVEPLHMLGLGGSVGTSPEGITAPVVVVGSEDELKDIGDKLRGKIVLFNNAMPPYDPAHGSGYGTAVRYRYNGARWAAEHGGVAALVRSVTARSLRTPHAGGMSYGEPPVKIPGASAEGADAKAHTNHDQAPPKVPTAAISIEDAEAIAHLQEMGVPVVVNIKMDAKMPPDVESANVIGELRGREKPDEIVVIGGHIDSWDVGHGAHDDGGGCIIAMEAINVLRKLNMIPRRTIRVVLWTNEENGLAGGKTYAKDHADELKNHVAAIESDSGVFKPEGYSVECKDEPRVTVAAEQMRDLLTVFDSAIGHMKTSTGWSGADISPMKDAGVMLLGHDVAGSTYFDYHHTNADTLDKVNPRELSENVAVLATTAYILADMPDKLGERAGQ